jgi:hypothetical protein
MAEKAQPFAPRHGYAMPIGRLDQGAGITDWATGGNPTRRRPGEGAAAAHSHQSSAAQRRVMEADVLHAMAPATHSRLVPGGDVFETLATV